MSKEFTREALHALVWSEPMQHLAKQFGISDRGLAKICAAADIPVPARGYWAKLQAGHNVRPCPLPPRALGQTDRVHIGQNRWYYERESDDDILSTPVPPPPVFTPDMEAVRAQVQKLVRKAPLPLRDSHGWHSQVAKLLSADEERIKKQKASPWPSSWDGPLFNTPFETRRLRVLNALFICLTRCGMKGHISGKEGRDLSVTVGDVNMSFTLDSTAAAKLLERERQGYGFTARGDKDRLRLTLGSRWSTEPGARSWEDAKGDCIERHLREIAVEVIVSAEQRVRDGAAGQREWLIERQAEIVEKRRQQAIEEERLRREELARQEKLRVDHLLAQAGALHQATQIRAYVAAVRELNTRAPEPMTPQALNDWAGWALAQADRIDPVLSGAYKTRPPEPAAQARSSS
ncbi:MAG: hypothetical protein IT183_03090 [Acidobacteria bacterium]|nr:hypothetical protein [Acidobacteriota bacterium]